MPVDVHVCIYPPFFPDEDKESIMNKREMCSRGIEILQYLISKHRNKIWFMCKHETLIEARHFFISIYNPIKHFFDMYIESQDMPDGYKDCKFTIRYHEYMQWEIVYITVDLEVACRYLLAYVKNCIRHK